MSHKALSANHRLHCIAQHCNSSSNIRQHNSARQKMSQKSYSEGSAFPPLKPGVLRIYSMRFCPWAERTRLVLEHKNIPHETINIDLKKKPAWFLEKNPLGLVPTLELDDKIIYESTATCDWLDDVYPENPLQPSDPYRRAWDRIATEYYGKVASSFHTAMRNTENKEQAASDFQKHFQFYENILAQRVGPFFGDAKPALVDFLIWPHFSRIETLNALGAKIEIDKEKYPRLSAWFHAVQALPAAKATAFSVKTRIDFHNSSLSGNPNYDYGLEE